MLNRTAKVPINIEQLFKYETHLHTYQTPMCLCNHLCRALSLMILLFCHIIHVVYVGSACLFVRRTTAAVQRNENNNNKVGLNACQRAADAFLTLKSFNLHNVRKSVEFFLNPVFKVKFVWILLNGNNGVLIHYIEFKRLHNVDRVCQSKNAFIISTECDAAERRGKAISYHSIECESAAVRKMLDGSNSTN